MLALLGDAVASDVQGSNIFLFIVLILLFVVGYKILQAVITMGLIAIMSGVFLIALRLVGIGPELSISNIFLFMVLGTGLFILYSTILTAIETTSSLMGAATTLVKWGLQPLKRKPKKQRSVAWKRSEGSDTEDSTADAEPKEKEVILGEVEDD